MEVIKLLAWDADKKGTLGFMLHRCGKKFLRWAIKQLTHRIMKDVIEYKKKNGWINQEVKILYDDLTEVIRSGRYEEHEIKNNEGNYRMYSDVRDLLCVLLDEDSYYLLRFFYFLDLTFEHENRYRLAHHKARVYWHWEEIADVLRAKRAEFEKMNPGLKPTDEDYDLMYSQAINSGKIKGKDNIGNTQTETKKG